MSDPFYGEIKMIGFSYPPIDYAFCSGQTMLISGNEALYALLGVQYGGDGRVNFNLPDLRGRVPIHSANGDPGPQLSSYKLGEVGGSEAENLTEKQMPLHNHTATVTDASVTVNCSGVQGTKNVAAGNYWAQGGSDNRGINIYNADADAKMNANAVSIEGLSIDIGDSGGTNPYLLLQPYLAINFVIALQGLFPPRN